MSLTASEFYEAWSREIGSRVDDIVGGSVQTIPGEQVFADIAARRSTRNAWPSPFRLPAGGPG